MARARWTVLFVLSLTLGGCSSLLKFRVSGYVKDAASGKPVADVAIRVSAECLGRPPSGDMRQTPNVTPKTVRTDPQGAFSLTVNIVDRTVAWSRPRWTFVFEKRGYKVQRMEYTPGTTAERVFFGVLLEPE